MTIQSSPARAPRITESAVGGRLHLTLAISEYDHVNDLINGRVRPEGIALTPLTLPIEEIFFRHIKNAEFDVAETSSAKYLAMVSTGSSPLVAIPVFPSRVFRHSAFYVRKDSGIASAKDLEGRTVGIPEWAQTAGIYARGLLAEYYGVDLAAIRWLQAGVNEPGRVEKVSFNLPRGVAYESRPDRSLSQMLLSGEIDAACTARAPDCFLAGDPQVVRLFPDSQTEEQRYFRDTGIFPIMHVMTMRRAVFEQHPWVARNLLLAFEAAKDAALARLRDITASRIPLPWVASIAATAEAAAGGDLWPYGIDANRTTLDAFCRFAHAQGLTATRLEPEDLFPKELRATARV